VPGVFEEDSGDDVAMTLNDRHFDTRTNVLTQGSQFLRPSTAAESLWVGDDWKKLLDMEPTRRKTYDDPVEFCHAVYREPFDYILNMLNFKERFFLFAGGWRVGKSCTAAMVLVYRAAQRGGRYWIISSDYSLTHAEFDYATEFLQVLGFNPDISRPMQGQWTCKVGKGANKEWLFIQTKSASDPKKIEAENLDGVILAEAAQLSSSIVNRAQGRILQKGGWMFASGSFEQAEVSPWFREKYNIGFSDNEDNWKTFNVPSWANTAVFPGGRDDPKIKTVESQLPRAVFMEKVCASPQKSADLVFPEFDPQLHLINGGSRVDSGKECPWELAVDFGYGSNYAILALQWRDDMVWVMDEIYESGLTTEDMIALCKDRHWWKKITGGVMDIAGRQHHGDRSQYELWHSLTGHWLRAKKIVPINGINRLHTFLVNPATNKPRIHIASRVKGLIGELNNYKWRMTDGMRVGREPIDMYNHSIKCLYYWLIDHFGYAEGSTRAPTIHRPARYRRAA
jgi:hypothetical protein